MNFIFSNLFWGILLIIFGLSIVLKALFKIDIPIFRIIIALILIYFGLKMLFGGFFDRSNHHNSVIFNKGNFGKSQSEYNIVFSSSKIDLRDISIENGSFYSEINIVFGSGRLLINPEVPLKIKTENVFGESKLPDRSISFLGGHTYQSPTYSEGENCIQLDVNVVFGNFIIDT